MKYHLLGFLAIAISSMACTPTPPPETEVMALLVGEYCDEEQIFRLQLTDSTYFFRRAEPGILSSRSLTYESCSGEYEVLLENNTWNIHFLPDDRPRNSLFENCETQVNLWTPEDGFVIGVEQVQLPDLFEGTNMLTKDLCE